MPECSVCTCMLVCAFCALLHTRPRVQQAPGIPCALSSFRGPLRAAVSNLVYEPFPEIRRAETNSDRVHEFDYCVCNAPRDQKAAQARRAKCSSAEPCNPPHCKMPAMLRSRLSALAVRIVSRQHEPRRLDFLEGVSRSAVILPETICRNFSEQGSLLLCTFTLVSAVRQSTLPPFLSGFSGCQRPLSRLGSPFVQRCRCASYMRLPAFAGMTIRCVANGLLRSQRRTLKQRLKSEQFATDRSCK